MGKRWYPEIDKPRPMRDRGEFIAEQLQMQGAYRLLTGKPTGPDGSTIPDAIRGMLFYSADPKEAAYYDIRDLRTQFMNARGEAEEPPGVVSNPLKEAAFNMKISIRRRDEAAFRRYLQQYLDHGGTRTKLQKSTETFHPLYKMKKQLKKEFAASLSDEDRHRLDLAVEYYNDTFGAGGLLNQYLRQSSDLRRNK
jgi:hypothetical protein